MATETVFSQIEKVRTKVLPKWYSMEWNVAADLIKKGEVERIGERDYRMPIELSEGGDVGTFNPQFGDMGRGSQPSGNTLIGSFFPVRYNFEFDKLTQWVEENNEIQIKKTVKDSTKNGLKWLANYTDAFMHGDGTSVVAVGSAHNVVSGVSVYTLDANYGTMKIRRGMPVAIYDTTLATFRGTAVISKLNHQARTATLNITVSGAAATDKLCLFGSTAASPVGIRGFEYWNSYAASGTTGGIDRATEPELLVNNVNAAGGLQPEHGLALFDRITMRRGVVDDLTGLCPPAQRAAILSNLMSLQTMDISGGTGYKDRLPSGLRDSSFKWCGVGHMLDVRQNQSRIDWISPKTYGRAVLKDPDFFKDRNGNYFFPLYGGSGAPAAGDWFSLCYVMDVYNVNPGANGVIYGLTLSNLYA